MADADTGEILKVLASCACLGDEECQEKMVAFLIGREEPGRERAIRQKVEGWFSNEHEPNDESREGIAAFYHGIWPEQRFGAFRKDWLEMSLDELTEQSEFLNRAVQARRRFFSVLGPYQDYVDAVPDLLKKQMQAYQRDFLIYRHHSNPRILVQDVLRIEGSGNGCVLCELHVYSSHTDDRIKVFKGNGFFHLQAFYLFLLAPSQEEPPAPEPAMFIFPPDLTNQYVLGSDIGLSDDHTPMCGVVLREKLKERLADIKSVVGPMKDGPKKTEVVKRLSLKEAVQEQPLLFAENMLFKRS